MTGPLAPGPAATGPGGSTGVGLAAVPEGGRVDFERLRDDRRRRLLEAMRGASLDALVLGRPANIAFASGARQLWTSGARPFGPGCVVIAATGRVHLLSVWDEGVPPEIGHEDLYGLSWNPANLLRDLRGVEGLPAVGRVGTDGLSPGFAAFLGALAPDASVVDAGDVLRQARQVKSADEIACLSTAAAIAEAALSEMVAAITPGVTERDLLATYAETVARLGAPTPPTEAVAIVTPRRGPVAPRHLASWFPAAAGDLVVLNPGAMFAGYEAGLGRTWAVPGGRPGRGAGELAGRARRQLDAVVAACAPGATGAAIVAAWRAAGGTSSPLPLVHGLGLGAEGPVVAEGVGAGDELPAGAVVAVQVWVGEEGTGGVLERETVLVAEGGGRPLTAFGRDPSLSGDQPAR